MRRALSLVLASALALAALPGCGVAPPAELDIAAVGSDALAGLSLALAPISTSYLRPADALFAAGAPVSSSSRATGDDAEGSAYGWDTPPADAAELQAHFASLLERSFGVGVTRIGRGSVPVVAPSGDARADRLAREAATCDAADRLQAQLLAHVDLLEDHVAWKSRRLLLWVPDLILLWGVGVVPVVLVPDENYEARLRARVTIVHARTREVIYQGEYEGSAELALNTFQRGITISGLLGLHPYFLSAESGDFEPARAALFPHALSDLDARLARGVPAGVTEAFAAPGLRKRVQEGTPETARTFAVVVGHDGPRTALPRPPLSYAANDAEAVGEALLATRVVRAREDVSVLTAQSAVRATRRGLFAAIDGLVDRMLGLDTLIIYYSGYGRTTPEGEAVLVLGGGADEVRLSELAAHTAEAVLRGRRPRVVFVLDTSFGRAPMGRNYRADDQGPAAAAGHLDPLANRALGWTVLSAAGADEAAYEVEARAPGSRHGFFTQRLLSALVELERPLTTETLGAYLAELVPEDVRSAQQAAQTPERRGLDEPTVLAR